MNILPFERAYWVIPNKLIVDEIPVTTDEKESNAKLSGLIGLHVKVVINLMGSDEKNRLNQPFYDYAPFLKLNNIESFRFPIKDFSIPTKETMVEILNMIDSSLEQNKIVYVHCWGGVGRTGTVLGCYLMRHGLANKENVIDTIEYLKRTTSIADRKSPETDQQRDFILNWKWNQ